MYPINEDTGEIDTTTKLFPITKESNIIDDAGNVVQLQHKLNFANGLKNTNGTIELVMSVVLNAVFPVGSIYCSTSNKTPAQLGFPGTWEQIKGTFLAAAGTGTDSEGKTVTFTLGQTGGFAESKLLEHTHKINSYTVPSENISEAGGHTHNLSFQGTAHDASSDNCIRTAWWDNTKYTISNGISMGTAGAHKHTITIPEKTTTTTGNTSNLTNKNIPPYLAVNMWKRTA